MIAVFCINCIFKKRVNILTQVLEMWFILDEGKVWLSMSLADLPLAGVYSH